MDAPHTGARLETEIGNRSIIWERMPPTRGHDLKLVRIVRLRIRFAMPPTRGHDLKQARWNSSIAVELMPPTRGHDLKLQHIVLEVEQERMPPTRGHDLKQEAKEGTRPTLWDAPHTGARLETRISPIPSSSAADAPHTGARLETTMEKTRNRS